MKKREEIENFLKFDPSEVRKKIVRFIRRRIDEAGRNGAVIGLSGGLDSAVVTYLCVEALGSDKVLTVASPERGVTDPANLRDAERIADELGTEFEIVEISPIIEQMKDNIKSWKEEKIAVANIKPRIRMTILYYFANLYGNLVVGTNNKSEIKCGYFTKYGDGASDISPLSDLYKTQVQEVSKEIGVPMDIIEKTPTAGLWKGQTDKDELGLSYERIDRIYVGLELGFEYGEIAEAVDVEESKVREFEQMEERSRHKLQRPPYPDLI